MSIYKALVCSEAGKYEVLEVSGIPVPRPGTMLCKVAAVAINPIDAKAIDYSPAPGCTGGYDFAAEVVQVGEGVQRFQSGDRVFGMAFGLNPDDKTAGAFAEYVLAIDDLTCHIPQWMSFEDAATFPTAVATAFCSIYQTFGFPGPEEPHEEASHVLVSGGATSSGLMAIQLLKLSGHKPIATCSPSSMERVMSLGAVKTFDYRSPTCAVEIREYAKNSLGYALDCITTSETTSICYEAIGSAGGRYVSLDPPSTLIKYSRRDVYADWINALTVFGLPVRFSGIYSRAANLEDRKQIRGFMLKVEALVHKGLLKPARVEIRDGGLDLIEKGIEDVRTGRVKGLKLVYPLA
ncbi:GroES-like protein [Hypoxylon argillaceum]|nr:GroES-like protein [Hypoxylon argillaceum]